jgi:hypothetical protein
MPTIEYISKYAGKTFDNGIQKIIDYNVDQFGWKKITSSRISLAESMSVVDSTQKLVKCLVIKNSGSYSKLYLAISHGSTDTGYKSAIYYSTDGVSWSSTVYTGCDFKDICYDGTNAYITVEDNSGQGYIWSSSTFTGTWTAYSVTGIPGDITSGNGIVIGYGYTYIYVSTDHGTTWTAIANPFTNKSCVLLRYYNNAFYAIEINISKNDITVADDIPNTSVFTVYTSANGLSWTTLLNPSDFSLSGRTDHYLGNIKYLYCEIISGVLCLSGSIRNTSSDYLRPGFMSINLSSKAINDVFVSGTDNMNDIYPLVNDIVIQDAVRLFNVVLFDHTNYKAIRTDCYRSIDSGVTWNYLDLDTMDHIQHIEYDNPGYILFSESKLYFDDLIESLIDLNTLTTVQNSVIDGYKNGPYRDKMPHPADLSVVEVTSNSITTIKQYLRIEGNLYTRSYNSTNSTFGAWAFANSDPFIYVGQSYPYALSNNALFIKTNSENVIQSFSMYDATNSKWIEIADSGNMSRSANDPTGKATDLFSAQTAAINGVSSPTVGRTTNDSTLTLANAPTGRIFLDVKNISSVDTYIVAGKFESVGYAVGTSPISSTTAISLKAISGILTTDTLIDVIVRDDDIIYYIESNGTKKMLYANLSAPAETTERLISNESIRYIGLINTGNVLVVGSEYLYSIDSNGFYVRIDESHTTASIPSTYNITKVILKSNGDYYILGYNTSGLNSTIYYINTSGVHTSTNGIATEKIADAVIVKDGTTEKIIYAISKSDGAYYQFYSVFDGSSVTELAADYKYTYGHNGMQAKYDVSNNIWIISVCDPANLSTDYTYNAIRYFSNYRSFTSSLNNLTINKCRDAVSYSTKLYYYTTVFGYFEFGSPSSKLADHIANVYDLKHVSSEEKTTFNNKLNSSALTTIINKLTSDANSYTNTQISTKLKIEENSTTLDNSNTDMNNHIARIIDSASEDATLLNHLPSDKASTLRTLWNSGAPNTHEHKSDGKVEIDASKIVSGVIDSARLPAGIIKKVITVASETAKAALTYTDVNKGDVVHVYDSTQTPVYEKWYKVRSIDDSTHAITYLDFIQNSSMNISWSIITDTPTTIAGYGITDKYTKTEFNTASATLITDSDAYVDTTITNVKEFTEIAKVNTGVTTTLYDMEYYSGMYVVVGAGGTILSTNNTSSWHVRTSGTTKDLFGVSNDKTKFIAVGDGIILGSKDGIEWSTLYTADGVIFSNVSASASYIVAIGNNTNIYYSSDHGTTWTVKTDTGFTSNPKDITYNSVSENFLIITSTTMHQFNPATSEFTSITIGYSGASAIICDAKDYMLVVCGDSGLIAYASYKSKDIKFTSVPPLTAANIVDVEYNNDEFAALTLDGFILFSHDGITWELSPKSIDATKSFYHLSYGVSSYVASGTEGGLYSIKYGSLSDTIDSTLLNNDSAIKQTELSQMRFATSYGLAFSVATA